MGTFRTNLYNQNASLSLYTLATNAYNIDVIQTDPEWLWVNNCTGIVYHHNIHHHTQQISSLIVIADDGRPTSCPHDDSTCVTVANCPSLSRYTMDPLGGHRTYAQLLATAVGSLTSNRCVSPARGGMPFHVASKPLLLHQLATSHRHCQPAHYHYISATQWETCNE